jgi:hypothetical protein
MDTPLTDTDIRQWLPDCKILEYDWLENYKTIDDLLPNKKDYCFILYERENHVGHWICVLKNNGTILHWDSFGLKPDEGLTWINKQKRKELNCFIPYLTNIYKNSSYKIIWNKHKYQNDNANTCGRWCLMRILYFLARNDNESGFKKWVQKWKSKGQTNDDFVLNVI